MKNNFKFVIVGTGNISNSYANIINSMDGVEICGVVSRSGKKPPALHDRDVEVESAVKKIKTDFDAVIIATPNGQHHLSAIEAASLGKHVLSEKVLDISLDACDKMINACTENKVKLGVAYQRRMNRANRQIKMLLDKNAFGKIFAVDMEAKFFRGQDYYDSCDYRGGKAIDGGGPFMQQAAHDIDIMVWFFGLPLKVASSLGTFLHDIESEDHGAVIMKFRSGMIGTLIASTCCKPGAPAKMTIHSEKGKLVLSDDKISEIDMDGINLDSIKSMPYDDLGSGHCAIINDFVQAVKNDRLPAVSGDDARRSVELISRIYDSDI